MSFFKTSIKNYYYTNFIDMQNISIANRLSKIDYNEYLDIIKKQEQDLTNDKKKPNKNDKIATPEELMNMQNELK